MERGGGFSGWSRARRAALASGRLTDAQRFIAAVFQAVLTCCKDDWPDVLRPGRQIDAAFLASIAQTDAIDPSGENGEYHAFVFDGPLFARPIDWKPGEIRRANGFSQIDLILPSAPGLAD